VEAGNRHLFPSEDGKHRNETEFGAELSRRVEWELGAAFNVHLVRHFAVARCLRASPGSYAMAARIVGHRSMATTMRYYSGLEFRPGGHSLDSLLKQEPQDFPVIPSSVLYRWGLGLMDEAAAGGVAKAPSTERSMEGYGGQAAAGEASADEVMSFQCDREFRDGLIIAILTCRAPRLRSLAGIRIGQQLQKIGEEFWLCFSKADIKNRKAIEYSLPETARAWNIFMPPVTLLLLDPYSADCAKPQCRM
jgi:hypothetical protein